MNEDNFDRFVNSLIKEKDLKGLTPEGREQVAAELKNLISEEVNRAILMELSDEKLDELDKAGEIYWSPTGNPRRMVFCDQQKGIPRQDIWLDFRDSINQSQKTTEYPTEKNYDM